MVSTLLLVPEELASEDCATLLPRLLPPPDTRWWGAAAVLPPNMRVFSVTVERPGAGAAPPPLVVSFREGRGARGSITPTALSLCLRGGCA